MTDRTTSARAATHPARLRLFADTFPGTDSVTSEASPPALWFAILTYNALAYTKRCLASLDRTTPEPWHAVILDNGSVDGTREWLAALDDPRLSIELGDNNRGVAGGRNRLLELIGDQVPADGFIVFIDNDLEFFDGWLAPFRTLFARESRAGMASCVGFEMVVHGAHRELISYPGLVQMPVDVASGGFACFVKPAVFRAIGRFDEQLNPFWHEDDDISVRTKRAGWEVWAVPNAAVVHHGHKSGNAVDASSYTRSQAKQAYLVDKWRTLGIVAEDDRLHFGGAAAADPLGTALAARLSRTSVVRRSEYERARLDISQLRHTLRETGSLHVRTRYATAPALALLEERLSHTSPHVGSIDPSARAELERVREAVLSLRDTRRRQTRLPVRGIVTLSANKLADAADWQDDTWFAAVQEFAADGRGRAQWYDRTADSWQCAQTAQVLSRVGVLVPNREVPERHVLVVGDVRRHFVWALAEAVGQVTVCDFIHRYGVAAETMWLESPERFALRDVPAGRVRACDVRVLDDVTITATIAGSGANASLADAAVLMPWTDDLSLGDQGALLRLLPRQLRPGGVIVTTVAVRLAGPPDARVLESPTRLAGWLGTLGLEPVGDIDTSMSDEGLLAATDRDMPDRRTPDLLTADGARLSGRLCFACRAKTSA